MPTFPVPDLPDGTRAVITRPYNPDGRAGAGVEIQAAVDIRHRPATPDGQIPALAYLGARVVRAYWSKWGYIVDLDHGGLESHYVHLATLAQGVEQGARVAEGAPLGLIGHDYSRRNNPCHLHLGMRRGGVWVDPAPLLRRSERIAVAEVPGWGETGAGEELAGVLGAIAGMLGLG